MHLARVVVGDSSRRHQCLPRLHVHPGHVVGGDCFTGSVAKVRGHAGKSCWLRISQSPCAALHIWPGARVTAGCGVWDHDWAGAARANILERVPVTLERVPVHAGAHDTSYFSKPYEVPGATRRYSGTRSCPRWRTRAWTRRCWTPTRSATRCSRQPTRCLSRCMCRCPGPATGVWIRVLTTWKLHLGTLIPSLAKGILTAYRQSNIVPFL